MISQVYEERISQIVDTSCKDLVVYKRKLADKTDEFETFKHDIMKEMKLKELLIKRHQEYAEIMK